MNLQSLTHNDGINEKFKTSYRKTRFDSQYYNKTSEGEIQKTNYVEEKHNRKDVGYINFRSKCFYKKVY